MLPRYLKSDVAFPAKTATEIQEIGQTNGSILVIPVGAMEQHGKHLPVATDTLLVGDLALHGAEAVANLPLLVLPPVWTGNSAQHLSFGGTVTVSFDTLRDLLREVAATATANEFDAVLLVNGHVGNRTALDAAVDAIGQENPEVETLGITYFDLAAPFIDGLRESETGGMGHAGEFETSLMLHRFPDLVDGPREDTQLAEPYDLGGSDLFEHGPLSVHRTLDAYTDTGVLGHASAGTSERGEEIFTQLCDALAALYTEIHEANR